MKCSLLPEASMLCREESVATTHSSLTKNVRSGMLQLSSPLCRYNTFASSATGHLVEIKNIVESYCLFNKEKKRQSPCQKGRGKEKPKHELISLLWRIKAGFVLLYSYQVRTRDSSLFWAWIAKFVLYAVLPTCFSPHVTKLPLFLKNSFCWCSNQVFKPRWNLYNSKDIILPVLQTLTLQKHIQRHSYAVKTNLGYTTDSVLKFSYAQTIKMYEY